MKIAMLSRSGSLAAVSALAMALLLAVLTDAVGGPRGGGGFRGGGGGFRGGGGGSHLRAGLLPASEDPGDQGYGKGGHTTVVESHGHRAVGNGLEGGRRRM